MAAPRSADAAPRAGRAGRRPPAVECRSLVRRFGPVVAVDGVDLEIRAGEVVALLGPSGCGKTTLLRLIAGFERPDGGEVLLDGAPVAGPDVFVPPERRRVGIVVQDHALFPHLTVAGNVGFGLPGRRRHRHPRVAEVLSLVGLAGFEDRYPSQLSGGQQQRVALARALAPRPAVVLLDEPFSGLDAALRVRLRAEVISILRAAEATAVLVTHDQEEALSVADRVGVVHDGRIVQVGTPEEVYRHPADPFVAAFVGDADLLEGESDGRGGVVTALGHLPAAGDPPPAGRVVAVVRPEAVRLAPDPGGRAEVVSAAYFGHDQLVEVSVGGLRLRARVVAGRAFAAGERVEVDVAGRVTAFAAQPERPRRRAEAADAPPPPS